MGVLSGDAKVLVVPSDSVSVSLSLPGYTQTRNVVSCKETKRQQDKHRCPGPVKRPLSFELAIFHFVATFLQYLFDFNSKLKLKSFQFLT